MKAANTRTSSRPIIKMILILAFSSCNPTQFRSVANVASSFATEPAFEIPLDPELPVVVTEPPIVLEPPPTVEPPVAAEPPAQPVQKSGDCKTDSSTELLSCMNCVVPLSPAAPPQLSEKGKALLEIMTLGCSIPNKSAPKGYTPPTKQELLARLNRLSPTLYPDTPMTAGQKQVIDGLQTDPKLQQKMFGGLWYQPPYSDHSETYFGISTAEAVYNLCYSTTNFTPTSAQPLQSKEYLDCTYHGSGCKEKPDYVKANIYRDQLNLAMKESIRNPYVAPASSPAKKCKWENFEGDYDLGGEAVVERWLATNYKVGMEIGNLAGRCERVLAKPSGADKPRGHVRMAGYTCF